MMRRVFLATIPLVLAVGEAHAQNWGWSESGPVYRERRERSYYYRPYYAPPPPRYRTVPPPRYLRRYDYQDSFLSPNDSRSQRRYDDDEQMPRIANGGPRPAITPIPPQRVAYSGRHAAGTIIIDTAGRQLLLVQGDGEALRYPISVGREGFTWTGEEKISRIAAWPDWHPPAEMRERDPRLPEKMTGGLRNPLGAKALYLGNTLYRIHGTNNAKSIGRAQSSGCFRMLNGHVLDLAQRVGVGTKVIVSRSLQAAEASSGKRG
ncbi:MAG: L,D-transpeptidase [Hyphomicrobiaceae bacterium]